MTCIIGFIDKEKTVWIGGDSAGVDSNFNSSARKDSKVFQNGQMIFGYTSSFRMGQLLRFKLKVPIQPDKMDDYEFMCTKFIDKVRECFKEGGYLYIDNHKESGGCFLVGYNGRLYSIECNLQVAENIIDINACGCGEEYALGAITGLKKYVEDPKELLVKTLEIVSYFSAGVRPPYNIIKLKYRGVS